MNWTPTYIPNYCNCLQLIDTCKKVFMICYKIQVTMKCRSFDLLSLCEYIILKWLWCKILRVVSNSISCLWLENERKQKRSLIEFGAWLPCDMLTYLKSNLFCFTSKHYCYLFIPCCEIGKSNVISENWFKRFLCSYLSLFMFNYNQTRSLW